MATDPKDVEIETLRARVAELEAAVADVTAQRDDAEARRAQAEDDLANVAHAAQVRAEQLVAAQMSTLRDRIAELEEMSTELRAVLNRHAPVPPTDLRVLVDEFVSKLPKG